MHVWDTCETFLAGGEAIACAKQNWRISVRSLWPVYGVYPLFLGDHWNIKYFADLYFLGPPLFNLITD